MTKRVNYPFLANCKDVIDILKGSKEAKDQKIVEAAKYIVSQLKEEKKPWLAHKYLKSILI